MNHIKLLHHMVNDGERYIRDLVGSSFRAAYEEMELDQDYTTRITREETPGKEYGECHVTVRLYITGEFIKPRRMMFRLTNKPT